MSALKVFVHNHSNEGDNSLIKTMTFAMTHFIVAFSVAFLLTGDILIGGLIAMVEPAINTVAYYFHEKFWARKTQVPGPQSRQPSTTRGPMASLSFRSRSAVRTPSSITGW